MSIIMGPLKEKTMQKKEGENHDEGEEETREWLQKKKCRGDTAPKTLGNSDKKGRDSE